MSWEDFLIFYYVDQTGMAGVAIGSGMAIKSYYLKKILDFVRK